MATSTLTSTVPLRSRYLARKSLGLRPVHEWAQHTTVTEHIQSEPDMYLQEPFAVTQYGRMGDWWTETIGVSPSRRGPTTKLATQIQQLDRSGVTESTADIEKPYLASQIAESFNLLYEIAKDEWFEDGLQSNLAVGLEVLLRNHPAAAIAALNQILSGHRISQTALMETLKVLGRIESPETHNPRLFLIVDHLNHMSAIVRDTSLVALCLLNDSQSIPYLESAATRVSDPLFVDEVKETIRQIRGQ